MPGFTGNASPKPLELALRLRLAGIPLVWLAHRFGREAAEILLRFGVGSVMVSSTP